MQSGAKSQFPAKEGK